MAVAFHGVGSPRENLSAVRTFVPLSPATIFSEPMGTGSTAEAAKDSVCRHNEGKKADTSPVLPFLPTHFWCTTALSH
jgi:hypothetical protein